MKSWSVIRSKSDWIVRTSFSSQLDLDSNLLRISSHLLISVIIITAFNWSNKNNRKNKLSLFNKSLSKDHFKAQLWVPYLLPTKFYFKTISQQQRYHLNNNSLNCFNSSNSRSNRFNSSNCNSSSSSNSSNRSSNRLCICNFNSSRCSILLKIYCFKWPNRIVRKTLMKK